jgi:hypothetical protein
MSAQVEPYASLESEDRKPRRIVDHSGRWQALTPIADVNGTTQEALVRFCESRRISVASLTALGTRVVVRRGGRTELAFAGLNDAGHVVAIKYRPIGGSSHDSYAENPSTWLRPIVAGERDSLDWLVVEGETDAARIVGLIGDRVACMVLPAGARTFRRDWAAMIPRGARVALCHDADEDGDAGAEKAAKIIGGDTVRVRPPVEGGDWCDWDGGREEFLELVRLAAVTTLAAEVVPIADFAEREEDGAEAVLGSRTDILVPENGDVMFYGDGGAGKTTLSNDLSFHLAAGDDWLGIPIGRPVRVLLIENEGPRPLFRAKLQRKREAWSGSELGDRLHVWESPWGQFSFADPTARQQLAEKVRELEIDVVVCGPLTSAGMDEAGTLQEVRNFLRHVDDVRRQADRPLTVILIHHENKGGKVSGAWEGAGDTLFHVQAQGHGRVRLFIQKARWASTYHGTTLQLRWAEGGSFELEEEEEGRPERVWEAIAKYVLANGGTSWNHVERAVTGEGDYLRSRRDWMLSDGILVNVGKGQAYELWHRDDPARPPSFEEPRRDTDTVADTVVSTTRDGGLGGTVSPCRPLRDDTVPTTRSLDGFEADKEAQKLTCRRCGTSFRRGSGNEGDLCATCAQKDIRYEDGL